MAACAPTDGYQYESALTEKGMAALQQQTQMDVANLAECLDQLPEGDDVSIVRAFEVLLRHAHDLTARHENEK